MGVQGIIVFFSNQDQMNRDQSEMIVLASSSPRRLAILRVHGIEPVVVLPQVDESLPVITSTTELEQVLCGLALAKAQEVYARIQQGLLADKEVSFIIAADTVVYKDRVLGKPADFTEAVAMLEFLRDSAHQVFTAVALIDSKTGSAQTLCDVSTVVFGSYTRAEIEEYVRKEQPFDKAGSYALQGEWIKHVVGVEGDRENVIGLPWHRIAGLLK